MQSLRKRTQQILEKLVNKNCGAGDKLNIAMLKTYVETCLREDVPHVRHI